MPTQLTTASTPASSGREQLLETHHAALALMRLHGQAARSAFGISAADDDFVFPCKQRSDRVAPDKARAAEYQDPHRLS